MANVRQNRKHPEIVPNSVIIPGFIFLMQNSQSTKLPLFEGRHRSTTQLRFLQKLRSQSFLRAKM